MTFLLGAFLFILGTFVGIFVAGLCAAAGRENDAMEQAIKETSPSTACNICPCCGDRIQII